MSAIVYPIAQRAVWLNTLGASLLIEGVLWVSIPFDKTECAPQDLTEYSTVPNHSQRIFSETSRSAEPELQEKSKNKRKY